MESGEHMPDKAKFVGELCRVTAPGGRIIVVTWCHRWVPPQPVPHPMHAGPALGFRASNIIV